MQNLKSLKEFENESNKLSTSELKSVYGGRLYRWTEVTGANGGDRQPMAQNYRYNGGGYSEDGPPYATGPAYNYP